MLSGFLFGWSSYIYICIHIYTPYIWFRALQSIMTYPILLQIHPVLWNWWQLFGGRIRMQYLYIDAKHIFLIQPNPHSLYLSPLVPHHRFSMHVSVDIKYIEYVYSIHILFKQTLMCCSLNYSYGTRLPGNHCTHLDFCCDIML